MWNCLYRPCSEKTPKSWISNSDNRSKKLKSQIFATGTNSHHYIEAMYQIWRSCDNWKLVKSRFEIANIGHTAEKRLSPGFQTNSRNPLKELKISEFSKKHPWGTLQRSCVPSLKVLQWLEVSQKSDQLKRWKERRRKKIDENISSIWQIWKFHKSRTRLNFDTL